MAVLSYYDLQERVGVGNPGPASIDLEHGLIYRVPEAFWNTYFRRLKRGDTSFSMPRDEFLENLELHGEDWMQGGPFYTEMSLPEKARNFRRLFGMRSSMARNGLMGTEFRGVHGVPQDVHPVHLRTHATTVETPNYPISQVFLFERGTRPLTAQQIRKTLDNGEIWVDVKHPRINDYGTHGTISLPWGKKFTKYKGGKLTRKYDAADFFEPCSSNGEVRLDGGNFYLGSTVNMHIGKNYLGWLFGISDPRKRLVHMNAPGVHPRTKSAQTMEIYAKIDGMISVDEYACELWVYKLTQPSPKGLQGTYSDGEHYNAQDKDGPVTSGAHKWVRN